MIEVGLNCLTTIGTGTGGSEGLAHLAEHSNPKVQAAALRAMARSHQHQPQPPAQYPSARLASASASSSVAAAAAAAVGRGGRRDAAFETVFGTPRGGGGTAG